jgi:hypothetical protein
MLASLCFFPNSTGPKIYESLAAPLNFIVLLSFVTSALVIYLYGDSTRSRLMSWCFIWSGLYLFFWALGIAVFFIFKSQQSPFHKP